MGVAGRHTVSFTKVTQSHAKEISTPGPELELTTVRSMGLEFYGF